MYNAFSRNMDKKRKGLLSINNKQKDYVRVASVLDVRRTNQAGVYFIRTRVTFENEQKYFPTGAKLSVDEWIRLPKAKDKSLVEVRRSIEASSNIVFDAVTQLCELNAFTFERLNNLLGRGQGNSVNALFEKKIEDLKANGQITSADYYQGVLNSFVCFKCGKNCKRTEMQKCDKKGIKLSFSEINLDFLQKYEQNSISNGKSKTTVAIRMRGLRTICNMAIENGIIRPSDYCFKKGAKNSYTIRKTASRRIAYTLPEIELLAKSPICETEKFKRMSRDLFLFSFWANGINFADLIRLRWSDYSFKNKEFTFVREKTKRTATEEILISFPLFESMYKIIEEWGNNQQDDPAGLVFSFLKGIETKEEEIRIKTNLTSTVNHNLKSIVKGINKNLSFEEKLFEGISTYTARHSYATILAHNRVPESYIGFSLGHSRKSVTESYIEAYSIEDRRSYNGLLQLKS